MEPSGLLELAVDSLLPALPWCVSSYLCNCPFCFVMHHLTCLLPLISTFFYWLIKFCTHFTTYVHPISKASKTMIFLSFSYSTNNITIKNNTNSKYIIQCDWYCFKYFPYSSSFNSQANRYYYNIYKRGN